MRHRIESILYEKEFIKNIMDYYGIIILIIN
jgi:hypothetical protein